MEKPKEYTMYTSSLMAEYFNALLLKNENKIKIIGNKIIEKNKKTKEEEISKFKTLLSSDDFKIYNKLEKLYKQHIGWSNSPIYHGKNYKITWYAKDLFFNYKDYGKNEILIEFKNNIFNLYIWYSDESGYDQGRYDIKQNITFKNIFKELKLWK